VATSFVVKAVKQYGEISTIQRKIMQIGRTAEVRIGQD
jgi:hypothetical protein